MRDRSVLAQVATEEAVTVEVTVDDVCILPAKPASLAEPAEVLPASGTEGRVTNARPRDRLAAFDPARHRRRAE